MKIKIGVALSNLQDAPKPGLENAMAWSETPDIPYAALDLSDEEFITHYIKPLALTARRKFLDRVPQRK